MLPDTISFTLSCTGAVSSAKSSLQERLKLRCRPDYVIQSGSLATHPTFW